MIDKLNNLSDWLRENNLVKESSFVLDIQLKLGQSAQPAMCDSSGGRPVPEICNKLTGLHDKYTKHVKKDFDAKSTELAGLFGPESKGSLTGLFTPEERGVSTSKDFEDKVLYKGVVLKVGAQDSSTDGLVSEIQRLLEGHGYILPSGINGDFEKETEKAVLEFQKNNKKSGLRESGEVDGSTLLILKRTVAVKRLEGAPDEASAPQAAQPGKAQGPPSDPTNIPPPKRPSLTGEHTLPKVSFTSVPCSSCAGLAIKEAKEQWDNGAMGEKDPKAEPLIQKYFGWTSRNSSRPNNVDRWGEGRRRVGKHKGRKQLNPVKERNENGVATNWAHWSAAYVSWVMGQYDGEGARWYVLEGHGGYIRSFKNKRAEIEKNPEKHIGKMYYLWFTKEEMDKYGMKPELGDVIGRPSHCDIYIGNNQLIGGNTSAKNESTGNKRKYGGGTSGPKPLVWKSGFGIIKRVKITGSGSDNMLVA